MKPFSILDMVLTKGERRRLKYVGVKKTMKPPTNFTSLEIKYYNMLDEIGVYFIPQYPIGGRFYDAYLPDENILFEFDGAFWHPKTAEDAKYIFQKKSMRVDELKNKMAADKGHKIIRIREDEPITVEQMKELIFS
jgi:very-short-patch-repair endonuclease